MKWPAKASTERRDQQIDWSDFLGDSDQIADSEVTVTGVTLDSDTIDAGNKSVTIWLSGGTPGTTARIVNTITTDDGRTETQTVTLAIQDAAEPVDLAEVKEYLRVLSSDEDAKIAAMIPRARKWVEDHTGLALVQREFTERHWPKYGAIRLFKGPLVSVTSVSYNDGSGAQTYEPRYWAGQSTIFPAEGGTWPSLADNDQFEVTYVAGFAEGEADDRLIGAMLALIEGEFSEGYAYPPRAVEAAERCCGYLRTALL
jgi:uncharacterized phiE125 gp8 family phage protein